MAQTKTKTKSKKRSSNGRSNGGRAVKSRATTSARAKKTPSRKSTPSRANTSSQSNASSRAKSVAEKAKAPALAAGAVLLGAAGGAAAMARNSKRSKLSRLKPSLPTPSLKKVSLPKHRGSTVAWVGERAKSLGDAGHRVADVSDQLAKVEKTIRK